MDAGSKLRWNVLATQTISCRTGIPSARTARRSSLREKPPVEESHGATNQRVPHILDFLCCFVGSASFLRLSLKEGAHAVISRAAYRKCGVSRSFFARCGIPRTSMAVPGEPKNVDRQPWYPTSREKRARYGAPFDSRSGQKLDPQVLTQTRSPCLSRRMCLGAI
jgi:hypothetical protein